MDRLALQQALAAGASLAEIARAAGKHPSTVSYWVRKHGLTLSETARHNAPRGAIAESTMRELVDRGLSTREIAASVGRSPHTVRYWLGKYGLQTVRPPRPHRPSRTEYGIRVCQQHGETPHVLRKTSPSVCVRCRSEAVSRWRRRAKATLVDEAGGGCVLCGYDRYAGALHFHHVDPATKRFAIGGRGLAHSIARLREEAAKCVLLCSNCHAEVEAGVRELA